MVLCTKVFQSSVQYTSEVYSVNCAMCSVQCAVCNVQCALLKRTGGQQRHGSLPPGHLFRKGKTLHHHHHRHYFFQHPLNQHPHNHHYRHLQPCFVIISIVSSCIVILHNHHYHHHSYHHHHTPPCHCLYHNTSHHHHAHPVPPTPALELPVQQPGSSSKLPNTGPGLPAQVLARPAPPSLY